jgi:hypothetical protein
MKLSTALKIIGIAIVAIMLGAIYIFINPTSPRDNSEFKKGSTIISVDYSRPFKKERLIFGDSLDGALVPYGKYWRLGANLATTLKINESISFGKRELESGKYRMYATPYKNYWKISINSEAVAFGSFEPDYKKDLFSINILSTQVSDSLEQLTIDFTNDDGQTAIRIRWDNTQVLIPIN